MPSMLDLLPQYPIEIFKLYISVFALGLGLFWSSILCAYFIT